MAIKIERISNDQAEKVTQTGEGQFSDVKDIDIPPAKLTRHISAFANSDGGDLYIGIREIDKTKNIREWRGFVDQESANGHLQIFEELFPLGTDFQYEFLKCDSKSGLVLHAQVIKTQAIMRASNHTPYIRRGAQSLPVDSAEKLKRLEYSKGISSFENEVTNVPKETVTSSVVIKAFISEVVPTAEPENWLKKQALLRDDRPTVAGLLLFADEPQAVLPKRCGIKVYRYKTKEAEGFRDVLEFTPKTVEGCLYSQIKEAVVVLPSKTGHLI